jgi:hypothetical protein
VNLTYILGAGASANVLPTVTKIPDRLEFFRNGILEFQFNDILSHEEKFKNLIKISPHDLCAKLLKSVETLSTEIRRHATIDTLAKRLLITEKNDQLKELKAAFSCFLLFEQALNGYDRRYDTFLASIMDYTDGNSVINNDIKIISWNYDTQIELAAKLYYNNIIDEQIWEKLNSIPLPGKTISVPDDKFSILRLNGIIGGYFYNKIFYRSCCNYIDSDYSRGEWGINYSSVNTKTALEEIILHYGFLHIGCDSFLNFAWEKNEIREKILSAAKKIIMNTDMLVVIGYSFPFYNRKIDKEIIKNMPLLKKIYIQTPSPANDDVVTRFKALIGEDEALTKKIISVTSVDEFYIPHEFD